MFIIKNTLTYKVKTKKTNTLINSLLYTNISNYLCTFILYDVI